MAVAEVLDPTDERRATLQTAQGAQIVIRKKTQASRISRYECGTTGLGANQLSLRCMELRMASSFASESYVASFTVFVGPFLSPTQFRSPSPKRTSTSRSSRSSDYWLP